MLSEYFIITVVRVGLHYLIPSVVQALCVIISVIVTEIFLLATWIVTLGIKLWYWTITNTNHWTQIVCKMIIVIICNGETWGGPQGALTDLILKMVPNLKHL